MITGINESEILTNHILCECNRGFDERKCNSDQWWNNDKCRCKCKKRHVCEKNYIQNPATSISETVQYLASIVDNLKITCNEIIL